MPGTFAAVTVMDLGGGAISGLPRGGTGSGGAPGFVRDEPARGDGGVGIIGAGLTVINSGLIAGGTTPSRQANAITFTGGTNHLELRDGYEFIGNVVANGSNDTLALGGVTDGSFNGGAIGGSGQYQGFEAFEKTGTSTWTLTGEGTLRWSIGEGALIGDTDSFGGDLTFASGPGTRAVAFDQSSHGTYSGTISGDGALIKTGGWGLTLDSANSYTGGTRVENGALNVTATGALGTGSVTVDGPSAQTYLVFDGEGVSAEDLNITIGQGARMGFENGATAGGSTIDIDTGNASHLYFDDDSGAGTANIANDAGMSFYDSSSAQEARIVNDGGADSAAAIQFYHKSSAAQAHITNTNGGRTNFGGDSTAVDTTVINEADGWTDISGHNGGLAIGSLSGAGDVYLGGNTLTLGGLDANDTIGGVIQDGGIDGGMGGALTKTGTGTLTLTEENAYTGETTVRAGLLVVNGSIAGSSLLTVEDGGTLGGSGTVGNTTIADGGIIAPGNSIGTLTVDGDLLLSSGSILDFELGSPGPSSGVPGTSDRIDVTGDLTLDGTLNLAQSGDSTNGMAGLGYYRLMTYGGTLTDNTLDVGITPSLADPAAYQVQTGDGNVDLFVAVAGDDTLQHWQGGDGMWNATGEDWLNQGTTVPAAWAGNHAVFKNQPGDFDGGTITVEGTQSFKGLQFVDEGYRLEGGGGLETEAGGSEIRVLAESAEIATEITGTGGIAKTQAGTLVLEGANTYQGDTRLVGGAMEVSQDASLGAAAGGLTFNGGTLRVTGTGFTQTNRTVDWGAHGGGFDIAEAANTFTVGQDLTGGGDLMKQGAGTLVLEGANSYGNTVVAAGTLIGYAGSISGDIANAGTVTFDQASDATFAGDMAGFDGTNGAMVKDGAGTLILAGTSVLDWTVRTGGLTTAAQRFAGDVAIGADGIVTFDQQADAQYAGALSGTGAFAKAGDGTLLYTGDGSAFAGTTTVSGGLLSVGTEGGANVLGGRVDVLSGAMLGGSGTVGEVTLASGATIAPGNSIGTMNVAGNIAFDGGSTYEVEVDPDGADSDLIHATGTAFLNGATVAHIGMGGSYDPFSTYTILTADGGIDGTFGDVTSLYAFLTPELDYDANNVYLELTRNDLDFAAKAATRNQQATAEGTESLGQGNAIYDAIATLPDDEALIRGAFDALSGEIHASAKTVLIEESNFVRDAVNNRIRSAFGGVPANGTSVLAYGPGGPRQVAADSVGPVAWGQVYGAWGESDGNGNAASLDRSTGRLLTGIDGAVTANIRLGLVAGYGQSSFHVDDRASSGSSDNVHLGLYGGAQWDALRLSGGLAYTWHDIETNRSMAFPGFADSVSASYDAGTFQAFGEAGYRIETGTASFEPFVGLAHVSLHTDGFAEDGGSAALAAGSQTTDTTFTTLGLHAATDFTLGTMDATAHGTLGWRHAFGDTVPLATHAFAGGDAFTVAGAPIAEDAAIIEAGLDLDVTDNATLSLSYAGQIASDAQEHGFNARLAISF